MKKQKIHLVIHDGGSEYVGTLELTNLEIRGADKVLSILEDMEKGKNFSLFTTEELEIFKMESDL